MASYYVLLAESVFTDEDNPLELTVEGDLITVNRNYPITKEVPILDIDGNPTGETRTVFDRWDIQQEQHPDLWGGQIIFSFLEHPGLGPYYYCVLSSEDNILTTLEDLKPNDIRWVANYLEFDQPIPNQWRGKLNAFLSPPGNQIPNGTLQKDAARIVAEHPKGFLLTDFSVFDRSIRDVESENLINIQPIPSDETDTDNGKKPKKPKKNK